MNKTDIEKIDINRMYLVDDNITYLVLTINELIEAINKINHSLKDNNK